MKISVSLPEEDVAFLDDFAQSQGYPSRSSVLQIAVRTLRGTKLGSEYEAAWREWSESGDLELWDGIVGENL